MKTIILYHRGCYDGAGAAWAVRKSLGADTCDLYPIHYGESLPDFGPYAQVVIVDWCPKDPELSALIDMSESGVLKLTILDHHKTAAEAVGALNLSGASVSRDDGCVKFTTDQTTILINPRKSGAILAWEHFHDELPPPFLLYIQDRDLWKWEMPNSKAINAGMRLYGVSMDDMDKIADVHVGRFLAEGRAVLRARDAEIGVLASHAEQPVTFRMPVPLEGGQLVTYRVRVANCSTPSHISELGHAMNEEMPFSVTYFIRGDDVVQVSLRSRPEGSDVSAIAKAFGGGGHKHAAGFSCSWEDRPWA